MKKHAGFTLIELMIVIAVIAIIAAVAIPNLIRSRMSANEAAAIAALNTIQSGQIGYSNTKFDDADDDNVGDYGDLEDLGEPPNETEPFIDEVLATGTKQGYVFEVTVDTADDGDEAYTCTARPVTYGKTGVRSFFVDESGVIRSVTADEEPDVDDDPI